MGQILPREICRKHEHILSWREWNKGWVRRSGHTIGLSSLQLFDAADCRPVREEHGTGTDGDVTGFEAKGFPLNMEEVRREYPLTHTVRLPFVRLFPR